MTKPIALAMPPEAFKASNLKPISSWRVCIRRMPATEAGAVFFRRGEPKIQKFQMFGKDVAIHRMQVVQKFAAYTVPETAWLSLHIPLSWHGDYSFNGYEVQPSEAILADCPNGYFIKGEDRDALTLGIQKQAFSEAVSALLNQPLQDFTVSNLVFKPSAGLMNFIATLITGTSEDAQTGDILTPGAERAIIDLVAMAYIARIETLDEDNRSVSRASEVVAQTLAMFLGNRDRVPSISELCAATGVGPTRVFQCFEEIQGMSPYKYLRLMKLDEAYFRLSDPSNPPRSVKDVSLGLGYGSPGKFAAQFKRQFGVLPSKVIQSSRQKNGSGSGYRPDIPVRFPMI